MPPININQRRGWIDVIKTTVGTENVILTLPNGTFRGRRPIGYVSVRLSTAIEATDTFPILFSVNGVTLPLTGLNGVDITVADLNQTGIYLIYYNKSTKTLQLMAPYAPTGATVTNNQGN
jgi:hypothetical protein